MGFLTMYPFIGFAERADFLLNTLHKVKGHSLLVVAGMPADRAELTNLCHGFISC
jgi:hypothetical protein